MENQERCRKKDKMLNKISKFYSQSSSDEENNQNNDQSG
jgi:hypothetical protein